MNTDLSWPIGLEIPLFLLSCYYDSGVVDFKTEWRRYDEVIPGTIIFIKKVKN